MRIALISDIHGNALALEAVLEDAEARGADRIVCLGDVATLGPEPLRVLHMLEELGCPCIQGNHDAFLLDRSLLASYTRAPIVVEAIDWCMAQLGPREQRFLESFVDGLSLALPGGRSLQLFHGSPGSHTQDLLATTPAEELDAHLEGTHGHVLAGGHTHIQMLRQHRGRLLVNPGSVGAPFREHVAGSAPTILPHAEYAIVVAEDAGVEVQLRRVELCRDDLHGAIASWRGPNLLRSDLLRQYS